MPRHREPKFQIIRLARIQSGYFPFGVASRYLDTMSWFVGLHFLNQDIWIGALVLLEMLRLRWKFKSPAPSHQC